MQCPRCKSKTYVKQTFDKRNKVIRYRKCTNKQCKFSFNTIEMEGYGWAYKAIIMKMKELVKDVK